MNAAVIATTFGVVFLAELPDKTSLASLVLATLADLTPEAVATLA